MSRPHVVCIVQARLGSSRLPGKSLRVLAGHPIIWHVMTRALTIPGVDQVVLATTESPKDCALADYALAHGWNVMRASELDVLERFVDVSNFFNAGVVMRITGDCPFLAPEVAATVLETYFANPLESEYVSNDTTCSGYPDGTDVEVFSINALMWAHLRTMAPLDREHVTMVMRRELTHAIVKSDTDWSRYKLSIDREQDYDFAARLAATLPPHDYTLATTMRCVEAL